MQTNGTLSGDCHGATNTVASRNDIILQKAFYNGASAEMFRLRYASLNIFAYAHGVRRKYSGSAEDIFLNLQYMVYFSLRPPKLVHSKYANQLQTVSKRYQGWRGVANQGHHREPAAGKCTYHKTTIGEAARGISRSHIGNSSAGPLT